MSGWPYNTARWRKLREAHRALEPICQDCLEHRGLIVPMSHVDHITPISAGGEPFPDHDGLRSLCGPCHSRKTARGSEHGAVQSSKPMKGCNPDGSPIDPAHPWADPFRKGGGGMNKSDGRRHYTATEPSGSISCKVKPNG